MYQAAGPESCFGPQRSKEHYRTKGYRESLIYQGAVHGSYRKVCQGYNRRVGQSQSLSPSSLQYETQVEANRIQANQAQQVQQILHTHQFDDLGDPTPGFSLAVGPKQKPRADLHQAFEQLLEEAPEQVKASLQLDPEAYEDPSQSTYLAIDDVCNKAQKPDRSSCTRESKSSNSRKAGKKEYAKRRFLFHTVARIITTRGNYSLTAPKISSLWPLFMAVLLRNQLLNTSWIFLVDGQRTLHEYLIHHLKWRPIGLILDWYHLRKKIHMQVYMGICKTDQRDQIMLQLEQLLWYGLVPHAIQVVEQIPAALVKSKKHLEVLKTYFERNTELIPNYALRKKLGLMLSSNRVEKENDYLVAQRQKNNGMSWTRSGSDALAVITTIQRNKELDGWLNHQLLHLQLVA